MNYCCKCGKTTEKCLCIEEIEIKKTLIDKDIVKPQKDKMVKKPIKKKNI